MSTKTRKAVYAASLDPITNGHINIIERAAPLYDELIVVVAVDPRKNYTFTPEERVEMAKAATTRFPNVSVDLCVGKYVVKYAASVGAQVIIRGLRNFKDLEDEQTLAIENRKICPSVETTWLPCLPDLMHVSSSMVKAHVGVDGWEEQVARSVPLEVAKKLKEKVILSKARKHWARLMGRFGNPKRSEEILEDLLERYSEPHRAYHNLEHIVSMLDEFDQSCKDVAIIELAIWFHDAIYNPRAKDNEEESGLLGRDAAKSLGLDGGCQDVLEALILLTKHSAVPCNDPLGQLLVDLDLMILGKPAEEFDKYEQNIRMEYEWVPLADFYKGRSIILQMFLDRPQIYTTERFREKYEASARKNLKRSIDRMQEALKSLQ